MDTSYEGEKAVLSSPDLYSEEWSCVRLIYQIATSDTSPDPARLNLYLRQEGESFDRLLWSAKEPSDSWLIASLDLTNSTKKYKVSPVLKDATSFLVHMLSQEDASSPGIPAELLVPRGRYGNSQVLGLQLHTLIPALCAFLEGVKC